MNAYLTSEKDISITYNGISESMMRMPAEEVVKEKIILSVGSFNKRKNHHSLINAFCNSDLKDKYRLVITGDKNKVFSETGIDEEVLESNNITVLRNLSEEELVDIYRKAEIVVSLSLYEGFGIPVLEGLYYGCKVVCSDIPVYKELYEDVAVFCNPTDLNSITTAINNASAMVAPAPGLVAGLCHKYSYTTAADVIIREMTK